MYHTIKTPIVVGPIAKVQHKPMTEEQYAAQWRKDARAEGHRKGFPVNTHAGGAIRRPDAYKAILQSIRIGNSAIIPIAKDTGYSRQFVQDRLRYLSTNGMIVKVGNQWRVKE